jgi:hypothetical protein
LFTHPMKGIGRTCATAFRSELGENVLRKPRLEIGRQQVEGITDEVKLGYISRFDKLAPQVKQRRKLLRNEAKRWLRNMGAEASSSRQAGEAMVGESAAG